MPAEEDSDKTTDPSVNGPFAKLEGAQAAAASSATPQGISSSGFGGSLNFSDDLCTGIEN